MARKTRKTRKTRRRVKGTRRIRRIRRIKTYYKGKNRRQNIKRGGFFGELWGRTREKVSQQVAQLGEQAMNLREKAEEALSEVTSTNNTPPV